MIRVQNQCLSHTAKYVPSYPGHRCSVIYDLLPGVFSMLDRLQPVVVLSWSISPTHRGLPTIDPLAQPKPPRPFSLHVASNPNNTEVIINTGCGDTETILSNEVPSLPSIFQGGKSSFSCAFPKVQQAQQAGWTENSSIS